jgi:hypothetical protein
MLFISISLVEGGSPESVVALATFPPGGWCPTTFAEAGRESFL